MTTKTTKGTKPAAKKSKRLSLSKQTIKDLAPGGAGAVRGGAKPNTAALCPGTIGCTRNTTTPAGCPKPTMACTVKP